MARKRKRLTPEAERKARYDANTRLLEERIAYHEAKIKEEQESAAGAKQRRG